MPRRCSSLSPPSWAGLCSYALAPCLPGATIKKTCVPDLWRIAHAGVRVVPIHYIIVTNSTPHGLPTGTIAVKL